MSDGSAIEWTDMSWNVATGCTKVSPGCDNCYMFREYPRLRAMQERRGNGVGYAGGQPDVVRFWPERLSQPAKLTRPRMIFVNSMSDTFHSSLTDEQIALIFEAMAAAPQHKFQVLTKRANRVRRWWEWYKTVSGVSEWPVHIWLGTSVESMKYLPRVDRIAGIAPITFLSAEPLLGQLVADGDPQPGERDLMDVLRERKLQWVIVGGESGPNFRAIEYTGNSVRRIRNACLAYGVPFFFKQWGGQRPKSQGALLDDREWREFPA